MIKLAFRLIGTALFLLPLMLLISAWQFGSPPLTFLYWNSVDARIISCNVIESKFGNGTAAGHLEIYIATDPNTPLASSQLRGNSFELQPLDMAREVEKEWCGEREISVRVNDGGVPYQSSLIAHHYIALAITVITPLFWFMSLAFWGFRPASTWWVTKNIIEPFEKKKDKER